jgi:SAM-dependent methyltransferase
MQRFLGESILARRLFFAALDRLFLRSRYVWREMLRLKRRGFAPERILDAGSGFGQYSFRLARIFPQAQILGLDVKPELVDSGNQYAKKAGGANVIFQTGDLLEMDWADEFDLALSVDVLEHIEDDRRMIRNIGASLRPGGLFVLTTPYWPGSEQGQGPRVFVGEHVRPGYSRRDLRDKLDQAGMELERFVITYGPAGDAAWRLLQRGPMSWLAKRIWLAPLVAIYFLFAYPIAWGFMQLDMAAHNDRGGGILAVARKR